MDISTDCSTCWVQCIGGVSLLSAVVCGTFPHLQTRFWKAAQYRRTSRSTHFASSGGRLNNIQGRNPGTCCTCCVTKGPLGTVCLQQDSDHLCLWPGYHLHQDTAKHGYLDVVKVSSGEWSGALLSSGMRVGPVYVRLMDVLIVTQEKSRGRNLSLIGSTSMIDKQGNDYCASQKHQL